MTKLKSQEKYREETQQPWHAVELNNEYFWVFVLCEMGHAHCNNEYFRGFVFFGPRDSRELNLL